MAELSQQLASGGLELLEMVDPNAPLIPPTLATVAIDYPSESESRPYSAVEIGAADLVARANAGWFRLASEHGLFGADREFLVAVKQSDQWWWARVRLAESWDVMGRGAAGVLGNGEGYPGFVMMSLDSAVVIRGDVWQTEIGTVLARSPSANEQLRGYALRKAEYPATPEYEKAAILRWLENTDRF